MKIKVLGSSGGEKRGVKLSSFLIDETLLLDAGSVTQVLKMEEQLKIKYVLLTHAHFDHIKDLPLLVDNLVTYYFSSAQLTVFSLREVIQALKKHIFNDEIWPDFTIIPPENPVLKLEEILPEATFFIGKYRITPFLTKHTVPSTGYFIEKDNRSLFYSGDTGTFPDLWRKISALKPDVVITEISFPDHLKELASISGHYTPDLFFNDLSCLHNSCKIFIFHIKPVYSKQIEQEVNDFLRKFPSFPEVKILKDNEEIII